MPPGGVPVGDGGQGRHPQAPQLDDQVILLCQHGYQSSLAAATLQQLGSAHATDVDGGFQGWCEAALPTQPPAAVAVDDSQRH